VLACSADVTPEALAECADAGMKDLLMKPFSREALERCLLKVLD
jgi:CheY-like chemotaxis protein